MTTEELIAKLEAQSTTNVAKHYNAMLNKVKNEEASLASLRENVFALQPDYVSGGMGDLNKLSKPYIVTSDSVKVSPEASVSTLVSINMESDFIINELSVVLYELKDDKLTIVDLKEDNAYGLKFKMIDPQSNRAFSKDFIQIGHLGTAIKPTNLITNHGMKPSTSMEFNFYNTSNRTFFPLIVMRGFRIRIEK